ncbi:MAG: TIGR00701 family protein [Alphaproteobacteria bacterium TMED62]|nr:MAG: TIGR00701 family protein [Alphaproteobacteria bacterium TMED62]|tara:strand:+ start:19418 stop:19852 length:435 start_codon:yes stop_codon:yes gene_type:complete
MDNLYLLIKSLHIISFTAWMAGMFYLPRIFVYHSEKKLNVNTYNKFLIMEKKLIRIIMTPAMIITWILGLLLISFNNNLIEPWLLIKILFVLMMSAGHGFFVYCFKQFYNKKNKFNDKFYRVINEVPTFLLIVIVLLVVFRPTF